MSAIKTCSNHVSADIGNTRVKFLLKHLENGSEEILSYPWRENTDKVFCSAAKQLKKLGVNSVAAVSVNADAEKKLKDCFKKNRIRFIKVGRVLVSPLVSDYDLHKIGLDRLANINAARNLFRERNLIVLDSGTALTIEIIKNNRHCGGFILPGERTMIAALHRNTAQLPMLSKIDNCKKPGINTAEAILRGSALLFRSGVKSILENLVKDAKNTAVIVTGGNGKTIQTIFSGSLFVPELTLRGVLLMKKENRDDSLESPRPL